MTNTELQDLVDRLARRLALARLALDIPSSPPVVVYHVGCVIDIADQIRALPADTALPAMRRAFGPATEALLTTVVTMTSVPDSVPSEWTQQMRCPACGQVPDALARCRCSPPTA